jgi:hypothetical protein
MRAFEIDPVGGGKFLTPQKSVRFGLGIDSPGDVLMAKVKLRKEFQPRN